MEKLIGGIQVRNPRTHLTELIQISRLYFRFMEGF